MDFKSVRHTRDCTVRRIGSRIISPAAATPPPKITRRGLIAVTRSKTGAEYLDSLRDDRVVYICGDIDAVFVVHEFKPVIAHLLGA